jgi:predicted MPP superfamily phosphohydrolase
VAPFTWLHLSDLHRGQPGDVYWTRAKDVFRKDLAAQVKEIGEPDAIFFTGDLSYSGLEEEFVEVDKTIDEIIDIVGDALLVPVPGNHDLVWPNENDLSFIACQQYFEDERPRKGLLKGLDTTLAYFRHLFRGYLSWWKRRVEPQWKTRGIQYQPGLLPGDFLAAIEKDGLSLGVAGLNSAFLDQRGGNEGKLAVEFQQLSKTDFPRWQAAHDACLLLMHHPRDVLHSDGKDTLERDIFPPDSFLACLCGHLHRSVMRDDVGASGTRRWIQGNSLFGLEYWGTKREIRQMGYSWARLEREGDSLVLTRWPRKADIDESNAVVMAPMPGVYPTRSVSPAKKKVVVASSATD